MKRAEKSSGPGINDGCLDIVVVFREEPLSYHATLDRANRFTNPDFCVELKRFAVVANEVGTEAVDPVARVRPRLVLRPAVLQPWNFRSNRTKSHSK